MRGRKPLPKAMRELKRAPGSKRREVLEKSQRTEEQKAQADLPRKARGSVDCPEFLTTERAQEIYSRVVVDHQQQNIARKTDLMAYARWAYYMDRWLMLKEEMDRTPLVYKASKSGNGKGTIARKHPYFEMILAVERSLVPLEDRLSLNPASRQSYLRGLAALPTVPRGAEAEPEKKQKQDKKAASEAPTQPEQQNVPLAFLRSAGKASESAH